MKKRKKMRTEKAEAVKLNWRSPVTGVPRGRKDAGGILRVENMGKPTRGGISDAIEHPFRKKRKTR